MTRTNSVKAEDISKHNNDNDAWVVINGDVWDVTEFTPQHPGGGEIIQQYFGRDASKPYNEVHGPSLARKQLGNAKLKGKLDESSVTEEWKAMDGPKETEDQSVAALEGRKDGPPPLEAILNMYDFEAAAQKAISAKSWAVISSAANDSYTLASNIDWYRKIWFRPRMLVGVKDVDVTTTVLGQQYSIPFFAAPCALAKMSHPEGERAMAKASVAQGTTVVACANASYSLTEVQEVIPKDYPIFHQLYFNKDRKETAKRVQIATEGGVKALMVTVDLPVVGKREADERLRIDNSYHLKGKGSKGDKKGSGLARATGMYIDPDLQWKDIKWLKSITDVPIFIKGIQCAADARKALEYGCAGIYVSNHGGRAVDTAQPSLLTLLELQANCPEVMEQMEVFIDGGIRRGTDILKAICLGASGVCVGRPYMYAIAYGQEGMEHAINLLKDELVTAMQMIGITSLDQAHPGLLNTSELDKHVYRGDAHPWARKIVRNSKL